MAFSSSWIYQIVDQFSGPAAKINRAAKRINDTVGNTSEKLNAVSRSAVRVSKNFNTLSGSINKTSKSATILQSKINKATLSSGRDALKASKGFNTLSGSINNTSNSVSRLQSKLNRVTASAISAAKISVVGPVSAKASRGFHVLSASVDKASFSFTKMSANAKKSGASIRASLDTSIIPSALRTQSRVDKLSMAFDRLRLRGGLALGVISNKFKRMAATARVASLSSVSSIGLIQSKLGELLAVAGFAFVLTFPIRQAIAFEDAMADVNKVVDFKRSDGLKILGDQILQMSKSIPVAASELAKVAAAAGQMGIAEGDIAQFTETATKMATAFGITAEEVAKSTGAIANIFKIPVAEFEKFGDTVNHISNNSIASADDLLRALKNKGAAAGKQMGLTSDQTLAFAAGFKSLGTNAERIGSVMQGLRRGLSKVSADFPEFAKLAEESPIEALKKLGKSLSALSSVQKRVQLDKIFGVDFAPRIEEFLVSLNDKDGAVGKMLELAESTKKVGSVQREFDKRIATTGAKLQMMKNALTAVSIKIGNALLPAVNLLIDGIKILARGFEFVVDKTGPLIPILIGVFAALLAVKSAMLIGGIVSIVFSSAIATAGTILTVFTVVAGKAATVIKFLAVATRILSAALIANPIGLVILAIAGLIGWVISAKEEFGSWAGAIIHVGKTLIKFLLFPFRLVMQVFDAISGTDLTGTFDKMTESVQRAGAQLIGFGDEFDKVIAKEREIAVAASVVTTQQVGKIAKVASGLSTVSVPKIARVASLANAVSVPRVSAAGQQQQINGKIDITLNDPSGAVQSVSTRSSGPVPLNVGQNMAFGT